MNTLKLFVALSLAFPMSLSITDVIASPDLTPKPNSDSIEISYGFSHLKVSTGVAQDVKIDRNTPGQIAIDFSLVSVAHAADQFNPQDFVNSFNVILDARRLDELHAVLSDQYFQSLTDKVKAGTSHYVVLALVKSLRPYDIRVTDSYIKDGKAQLAVSGNSDFGPMQGLVQMVNVDGVWKIDGENWYAGGKNSIQANDPIVTTYNRLSYDKKYATPTSRDLLSEVSPGYNVKKGVRPLSKVSSDKRRRAIMFVFLMNKEKPDPNQAIVVNEKTRGRLHVLGSKKIFKEQQLVDNELPMDFTVAKYDDGFAAEEWNLVLPNKKPRELIVSLLWSF